MSLGVNAAGVYEPGSVTKIRSETSANLREKKINQVIIFIHSEVKNLQVIERLNLSQKRFRSNAFGIIDPRNVYLNSFLRKRPVSLPFNFAICSGVPDPTN
jgi:hypothetical protein